MYWLGGDTVLGGSGFRYLVASMFLFISVQELKMCQRYLVHDPSLCHSCSG